MILPVNIYVSFFSPVTSGIPTLFLLTVRALACREFSCLYSRTALWCGTHLNSHHTEGRTCSRRALKDFGSCFRPPPWSLLLCLACAWPHTFLMQSLVLNLAWHYSCDEQSVDLQYRCTQEISHNAQTLYRSNRQLLHISECYL